MENDIIHPNNGEQYILQSIPIIENGIIHHNNGEKYNLSQQWGKVYLFNPKDRERYDTPL